MTGGGHGAAPQAALPRSGLPEDTQGGPLIFLVGGEPSGDLLGARLMAAFKAQRDGKGRFAGVGGAEPRVDVAPEGGLGARAHMRTMGGGSGDFKPGRQAAAGDKAWKNC